MTRFSFEGPIVNVNGDQTDENIVLWLRPVSLLNVYAYEGNDIIDVTAIGSPTGRTDVKIYDGYGSGDITVQTDSGSGGAYTLVDRSTTDREYIPPFELDSSIRVNTKNWNGTAQSDVIGSDATDNIVVKSQAYRNADFVTAENYIYGNGGDDRIAAHARVGGATVEGVAADARALNHVEGGDGNDNITAKVSFVGDATSDYAHSELYGGTGNDRLSVTGGTGNFLTGNQGNDTLLGSTGADRMIGGQGADYLKGFGGEDTFVFMGARGLSTGERDRIADFTIGEDLIDVHSIDAKSWRPGNQTFTFDADGSGKSGTIWVEDNPDTQGSIVYANTGKAMLAINLLDGRGVEAHDYGASDFIL